MAEALAIISSVAAVAQLTGQFVTLTTSLRRALKAVRRAPEEIQSFLMDTSNFTGLLNFFAELADRALKNAPGTRERCRRERMVVGIRRQCQSVCDKTAELVGRFAALAKGNMTPLEKFIERIRYLLDKPDVKDLRLSVQLAATIVNGMSTLFMWEAAAKTDEQRMLYLEQLRNQLPVVREASAQLAKHQQRHGFAYESGGPDDVMLVVSKEMLRQIDRVIRPHLRAEDAGDRSPRRRRRESRRDSSETDHVRRWSSPSRPSGSDVESPEDYRVLRKGNLVLVVPPGIAKERDAKTRHDGVPAQQPDADSRELQSSSDRLSSPSSYATSRTSEPRSRTTSPDTDVGT